jgi:hypothetical protein
MPKRAIFALSVAAIFSIAAPPCRANLGDTLSESIARYGKPVTQGKGDSSNPFPWYVFKSGKFTIQESFNGTTCWMEDWIKEDRATMSEVEQRAALDANTGGQKWGKPKEQNGATSWVRGDGATALYDPIRGTMTAGNDMLFTLIVARKT